MRRETREDEAGASEQRLIVIMPADQLNTDRKTVRPHMGRNADRRHVQRGPEFLKLRIAGAAEAFGRFARDARHEQYVGVAENLGNEIAALFHASERRGVARVRNRESLVDLRAETGTDEI